MKKLITLLFPILFLVMVSLACQTGSAPTPQSFLHKLQEWIEVGDYDVFVHQIIIETEVVEGKRLVLIEVEYANQRSAEALSCRRNQWVLYDAQGYSYEAEYNDSLYADKNLQYLGGDRFLNQGLRLRGWLAFKIPENASVQRLQFFTSFLGTEAVDILVEEQK